MADESVTVCGAKEVAALIGQPIEPILQAGSLAIAAEGEAIVAPYPAPRRRKQAFTSDRQRRGFFAKLKKGEISVPYRRSGDTLGRWSITPMSGGARLRNTSPHAPWIHSAKKQAAYHAGNWKTDQETADVLNNSGRPGEIIEDLLRQAFGGA